MRLFNNILHFIDLGMTFLGNSINLGYNTIKAATLLAILVAILDVTSPIKPNKDLSKGYLIGDVDPISMQKAVDYVINTKNPKLIINSNGGSVLAGQELIQQMRLKPTVCEVHKAISMGYQIMSYCSKVIIYKDAIIMQHMAHNGNGRENMRFETKEDENKYKFFDNLGIVKMASNVGLTVKEFKDKVKFSWWLMGEEHYHLVKEAGKQDIELK